MGQVVALKRGSVLEGRSRARDSRPSQAARQRYGLDRAVTARECR